MSEEKEMSFLDHLEELRKRLIWIVAAVFAGAVLVFVFKGTFEEILYGPRSGEFITYKLMCAFSHKVGMGDSMCFDGVDFVIESKDMIGIFSSHFMVSIIAGIILSFPFIFYQLWLFIKPGLKHNEIKSVHGIGLGTSVLFFLGVVFGYFILSPISIRFLAGYEFMGTVMAPTPNSYLKLVASLALATGLLFQLPVVIYFLSKIGIVTPKGLKKYRKHTLVAVLILSAIITPPDVFSQILVALPVLVLYEISIKISARVHRLNMTKELANT